MVTSDPERESTVGSSQSQDQAHEVEIAADILAQGVAVATSMHADTAGVLEAGTAVSAREIARGAVAVQATAHEQARRAASAALRAVEAVIEALGPGGAEASLTADQAMLVVEKAGEASAQLATAAKASGAFAIAAAATGIAAEAAEHAAAFELRMVANAVAARKLAPKSADAPSANGTADPTSEPS
jgi:hypothetical protein